MVCMCCVSLSFFLNFKFLTSSDTNFCKHIRNIFLKSETQTLLIAGKHGFWLPGPNSRNPSQSNLGKFTLFEEKAHSPNESFQARPALSSSTKPRLCSFFGGVPGGAKQHCVPHLSLALRHALPPPDTPRKETRPIYELASAGHLHMQARHSNKLALFPALA